MKKFKELIVNSLESLKKLIKDLFHSKKVIFLYYVTIELVEEALEEFIAWGVSNFISWIVRKTFSAILVFVSTQSIKFVIKKIVKNLTYKEGNDKVEKLKKAWDWFTSKKCTILGIGSAAVTALSGLDIIDIKSLPAINVGSFNVTPIIYYGVLAVLIIIASFFPESAEDYNDRKKREQTKKQLKHDMKVVKKQVKNDAKLANQTQAKREKAEAKAKADEEAKTKREQQEKEYNERIEKLKEEYIKSLENKKDKSENSQPTEVN